jgi:hypothetical protein
MTDTQGGERGFKTKESMENACKNFDMKIIASKHSEANISTADIDFLLVDSPSLYQLMQSSNASRGNTSPLGVVCVCTDTAEKTAVETQLARPIEALGWIIEIVTQP